MRKFLPIVAFGVALVATIVFVAHLNKDYDARAHHYSAKCVDGGEQVAGTGSGSLVCEVHNDQEAQEGQPKVAWWHVLITWPEGITTWAVILTLGAIIWQAFLMRKHAEHFEKLARVTNRQARIQAAAMQQWIEIEPIAVVSPRVPTDPLEVTLQFELLNRTAYLFTVKKIITTAANGAGPAQTFTVQPGTPIRVNGGYRL